MLQHVGLVRTVASADPSSQFHHALEAAVTAVLPFSEDLAI